MVGLPKKDGIPQPLFPYQDEVYQEWAHHKHIWIKKATGLGISEFFLRLMLWLAVRDDQYRNCQFVVVTGPNINLAKKLIRRMKNIIRDYPNFHFDAATDYAIEVNGVQIQAYPADNIDAFRSLDMCKFILLDEADFFSIGEQQDVRDVSERYIGKSNPWIIMVSTPNRPDGLFAKIEAEPDDTCLYKRLKLGYERGLNYIYTQADIQEAMKSPSFEREYNLKYLGKIGNFLSPELIQMAIDKGTQLKRRNPQLRARPDKLHLIGIDPGGGSSKTALCIIEANEELGIAEVLESREYGREWTPSTIADDVFDYYLQMGGIPENNIFYVDGARPDFINEIKIRFNEPTDWEKADDFVPGGQWCIIPVNFRQKHKQMLSWLHNLFSTGRIAIPEEFDLLITALRTAQIKEWDLQKADTVNDDDLDALRLACLGVRGEQE